MTGIVKENFVFLPPEMARAVTGLALKESEESKKPLNWLTRESYQTENELVQLEQIGKTMLEMYAPEASTPLVHEKVQYQVAELVNAQGWESVEERDRYLKPYELALERVAKARLTAEVVAGLKRCAYKDLPNDQRNMIIEWAYDEQTVAQDKRGTNYVSFIKRFELLIGEEIAIPENEGMILPWLYMKLCGDNRPYVKMAGENLKNNTNLIPSLVYGVETEGERRGKRLELEAADQGSDIEREINMIDGPAWLTLDIDPTTALMQGSKIWAGIVEKDTNLTDHAMTLAVPLSSDEARRWIKWEGSDKEAKSRRMIVEAWVGRSGLLGLHAGFGGRRDLYASPAWSEIAQSLRDKKSTEVDDWDDAKETQLSERVFTSWMEVMGGGETMQVAQMNGEQNPASLLHNASLTMHYLSVLGGVEQGMEATPTIDAGHSMSGEITGKEVLLSPWSCREWMRFLLVAPVATADRRGMPFLYRGKNNLLRAIINTTNSESRITRKFGRLIHAIGNLTPISSAMTKSLVNPGYEGGGMSINGEIVEAIHGVTLDQELVRLFWQTGAIHNDPKGEHLIDELWQAITTVGGGRVRILYGRKDPILAYKQNLRAIRSNAMANIVVKDGAEAAGRESQGVACFVGLPTSYHYLETTDEGRKALMLALKEMLVG